MKINEVVQEGWGNVLKKVGTDFVGQQNVDSTVDAAKWAGSKVGSLFKGSKRAPTAKTGTPPPAPVAEPTPQQAAPTAQPAVPPQAAPTAAPVAKPAVAKAVPAPVQAAPVVPRTPTRAQSTMVQQMRQQAGLPVRKGIPAQPTSRPATKAPSTMVQQMRQDAEAKAAAAARQSLLKGQRPTYGQKTAGGTPIPLTPAERSARQPYRSPVQNVYRESIDLAEVLWQKMKRNK